MIAASVVGVLLALGAQVVEVDGAVVGGPAGSPWSSAPTVGSPPSGFTSSGPWSTAAGPWSPPTAPTATPPTPPPPPRTTGASRRPAEGGFEIRDSRGWDSCRRIPGGYFLERFPLDRVAPRLRNPRAIRRSREQEHNTVLLASSACRTRSTMVRRRWLRAGESMPPAPRELATKRALQQ